MWNGLKRPRDNPFYRAPKATRQSSVYTHHVAVNWPFIKVKSWPYIDVFFPHAEVTTQLHCKGSHVCLTKLRSLIKLALPMFVSLNSFLYFR